MASQHAPRISARPGWLARQARVVLGAVVAAGVALLALGAAAVAAIAAVTVVGILSLVGGLIWLFARIRQRRPGSPASAAQGGVTLDARRTASGWTVDALGRSG